MKIYDLITIKYNVVDTHVEGILGLQSDCFSVYLSELGEN